MGGVAGDWIGRKRSMMLVSTAYLADQAEIADFSTSIGRRMGLRWSRTPMFGTEHCLDALRACC